MRCQIQLITWMLTLILVGNNSSSSQADDCAELTAAVNPKTFYSGGYPSLNYRPDTYECWLIRPTFAGEMIQLKLEALATEECCDVITIYSGSSTAGDIVAEWSGFDKDQITHGYGDPLFVVFTSNSEIQHLGFSIQYKTVECIGFLATETAMYMTSPRYPNSYSAAVDVCYVVTSESEQYPQVSLNILDFELEEGKDGEGCGDYVSIHDGDSSQQPVLWNWCGTHYPETVTSRHNALYIRFITDDSIQLRGFKMEYKVFVPVTCNRLRTMTSFTTSLTSPGYPANYSRDVDACWLMEQEPYQEDSRFLLNITYFNLQPSDSCQNDYLEIRDGSSPYSSLLLRACGTEASGRAIYGTSRFLYLRFHSDDSVQATGFSLQYQSAAPNTGDCVEYVATEYINILTSPNFPNIYPDFTSQCWVLTTLYGRGVLELVIQDMDIELSAGCHNDYLSISDGSSGAADSLGRWCGRSAWIHVQTSQKRAYIEFHTNFASQGSGFRIDYYQNTDIVTYWMVMVIGITVGVIALLLIVGIFGWVMRGCKRR